MCDSWVALRIQLFSSVKVSLLLGGVLLCGIRRAFKPIFEKIEVLQYARVAFYSKVIRIPKCL